MLVYAHRGSSEIHPENTMEAFKAAIGEGADGIETDLRLTRDGRIVLLHDDQLGGQGVADSSLAELSAIAAKSGRPLATLEELIELAQGGIALNLEIKAHEVVGRLPRFPDALPPPLFTSFDVPTIRELRALMPQARVGFVFDRWGPSEAALVEALRPDAVSLKARLWSPRALEVCRTSGSEILLWVVNDPGKALKFAAAGVDGVFTDAPGRILAALGEGRAG